MNLYNYVLEPFKGKGRCVTMDSAYMSNIMIQIGQYKWGINYIVGSTQVNWTGLDAKATVTDTKKRRRTHKSNMWQYNEYNELPLVLGALSDNAVVLFSNLVFEKAIPARRQNPLHVESYANPTGNLLRQLLPILVNHGERRQ